MKRLIYSGAGLLVLLLAFAAFNMATNVFLSGARVDLTEQKLYTFSEGTQQVLADLHPLMRYIPWSGHF